MKVEKGELCPKCGFMGEHHTDRIRKMNKKEDEPFPCGAEFVQDASLEVKK